MQTTGKLVNVRLKMNMPGILLALIMWSNSFYELEFMHCLLAYSVYS